MRILDSYVTLGQERDLALSSEDLLRIMDACGVERAIIFPDDRERAVANVTGNRRISTEAGRFPDRLTAGFCINPWFGEEGLKFARSARDEGAEVLLVDAAMQGFLLNDPVAEPLWNWAEDTTTPVHVRASPSASACPSQLWFLARKFTNIRWILGGGGTTDYASDLGAVVRSAPDNLWFETSTMRGSSVQELLSSAGADKVLFGSAAPRQTLKCELFRLQELVPPEARERVFANNLKSFLHPA